MAAITIGEIMTRNVYMLRPDVSAREALRALAGRHISGAPVLGQDDRPCGVISTWDLVEAEDDATVGDIMTPHVIAMPPETELHDAAALMSADDIHRIIVLDDDGRLVGIVTSMDLVRALAKLGT